MNRLAIRPLQVPIPAEGILEDERSQATSLPASSFRRGFFISLWLMKFCQVKKGLSPLDG
jgi:hypothetical protein